MNCWSFRGESFQDHQWYCCRFISCRFFFLCQRKHWLSWLLHSKFHSNYLWFSLITLALCPENKMLVPSVCFPLLSIKPWVLFSFLSIALPLPDDDYYTFQTFVDCFKSPFNHLVQPGHIYLAPLISLYLAAILQGKMLPSITLHLPGSIGILITLWSRGIGHLCSPGYSRGVCKPGWWRRAFHPTLQLENVGRPYKIILFAFRNTMYIL